MTRTTRERTNSRRSHRQIGCGSLLTLIGLGALGLILWQAALPLFGAGGAASSIGYVTLLAAILCTAGASWLLIQLLLTIRPHRLLALLVLLFVLTVSLGLRQRIPPESLLIALGRQTSETALAWLRWPIERGRGVVQYVDELALSITGRRRPPRLPDIYPTPDPVATPLRVIVPRDP